MFSHIQPEILNRIFQTELFLRDTGSLSFSAAAKTVKGLVFIQLYAVYKFTLTETFSAAIRAITSYSIPALEIRPELLAVAYDAQWDSLRDTSKQRSWPKRINLLLNTRSIAPITIPDDIFPFDGSHFRSPQLETIWSILGISSPIHSKPYHIGRIQEVVEHRNAIAHGRETAESVGGRFTQDDLNRRIKDMQDISLYILDTIETHCSSNYNLRVI